VAQREEYFVTYPILGGVCGPGIQTPAAPPNDTNPNVAPIAYCGTPLINDFIGNLDTLNVDMAMRWNITEKLAVSLEGLNLTNQASQRFAYVENPVVSQYGSTGRQYTFGFRYRY
jgi:outer membrane receptor protein involved in Fe transport